jgi:hypothetical protein
MKMKQSNLMKSTLIVLCTLIFSTLSFLTFAAATTTSSDQATIKTENTNWFSIFRNTVKQNAKTLKKVTVKKVRQFKKEYREKSSIEKVGWGIGMILMGVLVTLGSILTLSGWWFVIGLGLIIFGALKIVLGVLGVVF